MRRESALGPEPTRRTVQLTGARSHIANLLALRSESDFFCFLCQNNLCCEYKCSIVVSDFGDVEKWRCNDVDACQVMDNMYNKSDK